MLLVLSEGKPCQDSNHIRHESIHSDPQPQVQIHQAPLVLVLMETLVFHFVILNSDFPR